MSIHRPSVDPSGITYTARPAEPSSTHRTLIVCALAFLACILLTVTPLSRMPDDLMQLHFPWDITLAAASHWLPANLGHTYQRSSASIEFFCLISLAFFIYLVGALLMGRMKTEEPPRLARIVTWSVPLLAGTIFVLTPGVLSHDMMVYTGYSRLLATYHANPYFVVFSTFPGDPLVHYDQWASANSVYGPLWMVVCAVLGWFLQPTLTSYLIAFRVFALAAHLLNIWLVDRALLALKCSRRLRTVGMLLYGWSPLVLLESALSGHNDVFMMTFVLLGVLLAARAEQHDELLHPHGYLPPALAFLAGALVKFTVLPVLALYLLFLGCKTLRSSPHSSLTRSWWQATRPLVLTCLAAGTLALACYAPFWLGHSPRAILASFTNNPAQDFAENSLMRSVINWLNFHPAQKQNLFLLFFTWRPVWNAINFLALAGCLLLGIRRLWTMPTVSSLVTLALATMSLVLLLTPWFFTWYVTWPVALAALCLPARRDRTTWAFFLLALTFSYSALSLYLFNQDLLGPRGYLLSLFNIFPPLIVFLLALMVYPFIYKNIQENKD